ncbi:MAG: hypothetical protein OXJ90_09515 [Spirochaetaceae bacterium]|nr:hypothetical protein [Spirochaetaceae bacterium]
MSARCWRLRRGVVRPGGSASGAGRRPDHDPFEQANQVFNERYRAHKERCHRLLAEWIETTGGHFPLPDIALH